MTTEESSSCPICLESLFVPTESNPPTSHTTLSSSSLQPPPPLPQSQQLHSIGSTVPCGHCLHVHCWDEWMAASMRHGSSYGRTKCPLCNSTTTGFVRLFLTIPSTTTTSSSTMDDEEDDLSIETEDDDDNEEEEEDSESKHDIPIEDRKMSSQSTGNTSSNSTTSSSHQNHDVPPIIDLYDGR